MAITVDESLNTTSSKYHKLNFLTQFFLRAMAIATTLTAACLMLSNKETAVVFGIQVDARYSYSPAFKFFAFANIAAFVLSVLSLVLAFIMAKKTVNPTYHLFLFLHDLVITVLLMSGFAAAMAIAYVGKYGNNHTGWMPICDHFGKFCNKGTASLVLGFLGVVVYLLLTIISSKTSTQIQA